MEKLDKLETKILSSKRRKEHSRQKKTRSLGRMVQHILINIANFERCGHHPTEEMGKMQTTGVVEEGNLIKDRLCNWPLGERAEVKTMESWGLLLTFLKGLNSSYLSARG